ncbi:MAG: hypothetical protein H6Q13_848 [Bacteroidetes bacterium]|jgi:hypothetical protein|nr:hypothetical protein [Bacteroidota bacterium]
MAMLEPSLKSFFGKYKTLNNTCQAKTDAM